MSDSTRCCAIPPTSSRTIPGRSGVDEQARRSGREFGDYSRQLVETIDLGPLLFQNPSNSVSEEQGAWRVQVFLDKSLLDNQMLARFCESINLQANGCRTGQLKDFGPDMASSRPSSRA